MIFTYSLQSLESKYCTEAGMVQYFLGHLVQILMITELKGAALLTAATVLQNSLTKPGKFAEKIFFFRFSLQEESMIILILNTKIALTHNYLHIIF